MSEANEQNPGVLPDYGIIGELAPEVREALAQRGRFETLTAGHALIKQGERHESFSVVLSGKLRVSVHAHGDLVILAEVLPGEIIGEMCVIDPQNASADVVVSDRTATMWTIEAEDFHRFVEGNPEMGYQVMKLLALMLCRRLRHNSDSMLRREESARDYYRDNDY